MVASGGGISADYKLPIMSLPHRFGTNESNMPFAQGYLSAAGGTGVKPGQRRGEGYRVGIVWQGSTLHPNGRRSTH